MDAKQLMDRLADSYLVQNEIALQMQLGFPWLSRQGGELCISFKPHREDFDGGKIRVYAPQYEAAWVYPFAHVTHFRDLAYAENAPNLSTPLAEIDAKWMLSIGKAYLRDLYDACTKVLTFREENGTVTDTVLRRYQEQYRKTAAHMGLEKLYL